MGGKRDQDFRAKPSVMVELVSDETDLTPPSAVPRPPNGAALVLAATLVVGLLAVVLISAREGRPTFEAQVSPPPTHTPEASTTVAPPVSEVTTSTVPYVEPDREIEVIVTERDTLIRLEPSTGRIIWESRPFTEPQLVSIDPNSVTVATEGARLTVSLTDGTLLPP